MLFSSFLCALASLREEKIASPGKPPAGRDRVPTNSAAEI
jgi:hypothetical protein